VPLPRPLAEERIVLHLEPRRRRVRCPVCGSPSSRIHSHYLRWAWDLPWSSWPVQVNIRARRFFCDNPGCRATFWLPRRRRYWLDLDRAVSEAYLSGASYRKVRAMVERRIESSTGLMSLWHRFQEIAGGRAQALWRASSRSSTWMRPTAG